MGRRGAKPKDLKGKRFGKLVAISLTKKKNRTAWFCQCDCGGHKIVSTQNLVGGFTKSCGCIRPYPKGKAAFNQLFNGYRKGAKNRGLEFELKEKEFKQITSQNCYYCGSPPKQSVTESMSHDLHGDYIHNGVDRIDNKKGYTIDNCVTCCKDCNFFKRTLSSEEFIGRIRKIYNHLFSTA